MASFVPALASGGLLGSSVGYPAHDSAPLAESLLKRSFSDELKVLGRDPGLNPPKVQRFYGDRAALVDAPGKAPSWLPRGLSGKAAAAKAPEPGVVLESTLPLRAGPGEGEVVDLRLARGDGGFAPANPLVPLGLPAKIGDGVTLGEGENRIGIKLAGLGRPGSSAHRTEAQGLLYANARRDVDEILVPRYTGFELLSQIRSRQAPTEQRIELDLPEASSLRSTSAGGAEIVRDDDGEERTIAGIKPPVATDASGADVPVAMEVDGTSLVLSVELSPKHRFPVLVDPEWVFHDYIWGVSPGFDAGLGDWVFSQSPGSPFQTATSCQNPPGNCYGAPGNDHGLYLYAPPGQEYATGVQAQAAYTVPRFEDDQTNYASRPTSYIDFAQLVDVEYHERTDTANDPTARAALWAEQAPQLTDQETLTSDVSSHVLPTLQAGTQADRERSKRVQLELNQLGASRTLGDWRDLYLGQVRVALKDKENPALAPLQFSGLPTGWVKDANYSFTAQSTDPGLGMKQLLAVQGRTGPPLVFTQELHPCTGSPQASLWCPREWSKQVDLTTTGLAEGLNQASVGAFDLLAKPSPGQAWFLRLDRTAPDDLTLSGPLTDPAQPGFGLDVVAKDGFYNGNQNDFNNWSTVRSGVRSIEILVDGERDYFAEQEPDAPGCDAFWGSCPMDAHWDFNPAKWGETEHEVTVIATDQVGHKTEKTFRVLDDIITKPGGWMDERAVETTVWAHNPIDPEDAGKSGVRRITLTLPGGQVIERDFGCGPCPEHRSAKFTYDSDSLPEGINTAVARGYTPDGTEFRSWETELRIDHSDPTQTVTADNGLGQNEMDEGENVLFDQALGSSIIVNSLDGEEESPQSGVQSIEIQIDGRRVFQDTQTCDTDSCPMDRTYSFDAGDYAGPLTPHAVKVITTDYAASDNSQVDPPDDDPKSTGVRYRRVERNFTFTTVTGMTPGTADGSKRGLEDYFHYDPTPTGAGGALQANMANGNLVWHKVPIVNPGRGLSTFVNLTYNSTEAPPSGLPPTPMATGYHDDLGAGFSAGISGLTRINEPLGGVVTGVGPVAVPSPPPLPTTVTLTDPDGTRHLFRQRDDLTSYEPPPGVNLELRRYENYAVPGEDHPSTWAITRPDGVTYFFDGWGYARSIQDRNGNEIRFEYENINPSNGGPCLVQNGPIIPTVCEPRLVRVIDPAGNDVGASQELKEARTLTVMYNPGPATSTGSAGKIWRILDHGPRATDFFYNGAGQLTQMLEARGTDVRATNFTYGAGGLTTVSDGLGQQTRIEYAAGQVSAIVDRRSERKTYAYGLAPSAGMASASSVTDPRDFTTRFDFDGEQRPRRITDPKATLTELRWDSDSNVSEITEAAGAPEAATTTMGYDQNGMLTSSRDPLGRFTLLGYRHSPGTLLSPTGTDSGGEFVADLSSMRRPAANTWNYELDGDTANPAEFKGNVTAQIDPLGGRAETDYGPHGEVIEERDEVGNKTTYPLADYDPNGLPQVRIDPRGNDAENDGSSGRWVYEYSPRGNLTRVTDPRGSVDGGPRAQPANWTTFLFYDNLDRPLLEASPKDPAGAPGVFIGHRRFYDQNDNVIAIRDNNGAGFFRRMTYSKTDEILTDTNANDDRTHYVYDDAGNLTETRSPRGNITRYTVDEIGRTVVEQRLGLDEPDLFTSYAYDRRDNQVGMEDPSGNAATAAPGNPVTPAIAQANAQNANARRFTYVHDLAGNRRFQVENAGAAGIFTSETRYDANDNRTEVTDPRGFAPGAERGDFTTRYRYDRRDELIEVEDPFGGIASYERRDDGMVTSETSPNGNATPLVEGDYTVDYTYFPTGEVKTRSIPWRDGQYGRDQAYLKSLQVAYGRDPVGNPLQVTDARGNSFSNSFFHTGDLKSTGRPSWWTLDYSGGGMSAEMAGPSERGGGGGLPDPGDRLGATGGGAQADTQVTLGGPKIVERSGYESQQGGGAGGMDSSQPASPTDFGRVEPESLPSMLPMAGQTTVAYDNEMRLSSITGAEGQPRGFFYDKVGRTAFKSWGFKSSPDLFIFHSYTYDRNGNLTGFTDGESAPWSYSYDEFDRPIQEDAPGATSSPSGDLLAEVTKLSYDPNGNLTKRITPRGPAFDFNFTYDGADRLTSEQNPANETWTYAYDAAGNRTEEISPRGNDQDTTYDPLGRVSSFTDLSGEETSFEYDADGNRIEMDAPGADESPGGNDVRRMTRITYDGRGLPWQTTTGGASLLGPTDARTTITEYDPNGNLRRTVNPKGVEGGNYEEVDDGTDSDAAKNATVNQYNADNLLVKAHIPWSGANDKKYLQAWKRDNRGRVYAVRAPHLANEQAPTTCYTHYETGWIKSSSDQQLVGSETNNCLGVHKHLINHDYDRRGNQTLWESRTFGQSQKGRKVVRDFFPNGTLRQRKAISFSGPGQTENSVREYNYHYNANRSLVLFFDRALKRETHMTRDPAERELAVNEKWAVGRDTLYSYDGSGNVASVRTNGIWNGGTSYSGGKTTSFTYDDAERETEMTVAGEGGNRVTDTSYHPSGEIDSRVRTNGPGADEFYFFNAHGEITRMRREKDGSDDEVKNQEYEYDKNGNRTEDERGTYEYNPRDQLTQWDRRSGVPHSGSGGADRVEYDVNGSGAITEKRDFGTEVTTEFDYQAASGHELKQTVSTDTSEPDEVITTTNFGYDDFGEMRNAVAATTQEGVPEPSTTTTHYDYDEFERRTGSWSKTDEQPREHEATYAFDGLDRRDTRTELNDAGPEDDEIFEYSYVGTGESLAREVKLGGGELRTYDYDSRGDRRGQLKGGTFRAYAKDANGSVEGVESPNGEVSADNAYHYDPYGSLERDDDAQGDPQDPEEGLSTDAKENPFRFEGFYYDSGVKTYDMLARSYRPEIGRFTSQDRYEAASDDLTLQSDPLTQNRYAFAGGNPVSRVEFDGHCNLQHPNCPGKGARGTTKRLTEAGEGTAVVEKFDRSQRIALQQAPPDFTADLQATYTLLGLALGLTRAAEAMQVASAMGGTEAEQAAAASDLFNGRIRTDDIWSWAPPQEEGNFGDYLGGIASGASFGAISFGDEDTAMFGHGGTVSNFLGWKGAVTGGIKLTKFGIKQVVKGGDDVADLGAGLPGSSVIAGGAQTFQGARFTISGTRKINQIQSRGWSPQIIDNTIEAPYTTRAATNKATGGSATAYYRQSGAHVIIDDVTGDVVQLSNRFKPRDWTPDSSIVDPYMPGG